MVSRKKGFRYYSLPVEEQSELDEDLRAYAQKRGLKVAQAMRVILADWSDALRGKSNPFALPMLARSSQFSFPEETNNRYPDASGEQALSLEELARRQQALEAAGQFAPDYL